MNARDLYLALTSAGHAVRADHPEPGKLWITNAAALTPELIAAIKAGRDGLLAHARQANAVEAMQTETASPDSDFDGAGAAGGPTSREAAMRRAVEDRAAYAVARQASPAAPPSPPTAPPAPATSTSFPFGANNPSCPDGDAAVLLAALRSRGITLTISRADRSKVRADSPLTDADVAAIKANKAALLQELELENRREEEGKGPQPFRPGVATDSNAAGALRVVPDGVHGDGAGDPGRDATAMGDGASAAEGAAGGLRPGGRAGQEEEATSGPVQPESGGADAALDRRWPDAAPDALGSAARSTVTGRWFGYVRVEDGPWLLVAERPTAHSCWEQVLLHRVSRDHIERLVTWREGPPAEGRGKR